MRRLTLFLGLLVLLLVVPPVAASDPTDDLMIYWEDSCDNLNTWSDWYGTWWAVSPEYSHGETSYGIGHPWVRRDQEISLYFPRPPAGSGVTPKYVTFFTRLDSDPANRDDYGDDNSAGHVTIDGDYVEFNDDGEISLGKFAGNWVYGYFPFPASASSGPSEIRLCLKLFPGSDDAGDTALHEILGRGDGNLRRTP